MVDNALQESDKIQQAIHRGKKIWIQMLNANRTLEKKLQKLENENDALKQTMQQLKNENDDYKKYINEMVHNFKEMFAEIGKFQKK